MKGFARRRRPGCCIFIPCWRWISQMRSSIKCWSSCSMLSMRICNYSRSMLLSTQESSCIFTGDWRRPIHSSELKHWLRYMRLLIRSTLSVKYRMSGCFRLSTRSFSHLCRARWCDRAFMKGSSGVSTSSLILPLRTSRRTRLSSSRNSHRRIWRTTCPTPTGTQSLRSTRCTAAPRSMTKPCSAWSNRPPSSNTIRSNRWIISPNKWIARCSPNNKTKCPSKKRSSIIIRYFFMTSSTSALKILKGIMRLFHLR